MASHNLQALLRRIAPGALLLLPLLVLASDPSARAETPRAVQGYIQQVPTKLAAAREARHRRVAERRAGPVVMCHRGAAAFAPENTLEAYAAAMDYGADGCEVDVRRTADGVLVLFHDDMLDRLTDGFGTVNSVTYAELLSLRPRSVYGTGNARTRPPTFAALLALARQRSMLLHLDVKEPGLDTEIARLLAAADAWDHVVAVNGTNAPELSKDPRIRPLRYKGPGLFDGRKDMAPDAVREQLARPGDGIMVDDPRIAARELKRPPYVPVALPEGLAQEWPMNAYLGDDARHRPFVRLRQQAAKPWNEAELLSLLQAATLAERTEADGDAPYGERRTEALLRRAWAAQRLGQAGRKTAERVEWLEYQVRNRTLHRDWMFHGLDGAVAARALGDLRATEAAPLLIDTFRRVDPALGRVVNPAFGANPLGWTDFRLKMVILPALGELRCRASKQFLQEYLALPEADARELAPLLYEDATRSLLRQVLTQAEIETLLRHANTAVRGTATLICLDQPTTRRTAALKAATPWALALPRAHQCNRKS